MAATAENREMVAMLPLSKYLKGWPVGSPRQPALDLPGHVLAALHGDLGDARAGCSARSCRRPRTPRDAPGRLRSSFTFTRPARSTSASLCSASCWPSGEALTPAAHTLQRDRIRRSVPSGSITSTPVLSTPTTLTLSCDLDADLGQLLAGRRGQLLAERPEHRRGGVQQDHPGLAGVDPAEVAAQRPVRQLGDLARPSPPRWGRRRPRRRSATPRPRPGRCTARPARTSRRSGRAAPARRRCSSSRARTRRTGRCRSRTGRPRRPRPGCRTGSPWCPAG